MQSSTTHLRIQLNNDHSTSAILRVPSEPSAAFVFAHGAGAGMNHRFMSDLSAALVEHSIATLRYQFPYMEEGSSRPDAPERAQAAVRAAVHEAGIRLPDVRLFAGGKSFGGRMTSQAQALRPLDGVQGLIFVGFPLHAAGKPSIERARHLDHVSIPMLFLQGTRDALAEISLVRSTVSHLGDRAALHIVDGADHSFHVLVRSRRTDGQVLEELADAMAAWMHRDKSSVRS